MQVFSYSLNTCSTGWFRKREITGYAYLVARIDVHICVLCNCWLTFLFTIKV